MPVISHDYAILFKDWIVKVRPGKLDYLFLIHKKSDFQEVIFHYSLLKKILQIKLSVTIEFSLCLLRTSTEVQVTFAVL